ncbi:MAG TPA: DinB family protein [Candidatus Acidoferrales bacterium]|jgi:uncharacterized damage-inducible protein DinB|nr:DinB family protein [Candidatus Acidoferrales bacterium]
MKRIIWSLVSLALSLALNASPLAAQAAPAAPTAPASGLRAEFLFNMSGVERELVSLAEKMPAEKYSWRPGEGVRSVSEVYMHVAGGQFNYASVLGVPIPTGFDQNFEKVYTDKAKVVEWLKLSFANVKQAAMNLSDADLDQTVKLFGREGTKRSVLLRIISHGHEHLGQSIAYARMNGIVPPWTEEAQQRQQAAPPKKQP